MSKEYVTRSRKRPLAVSHDWHNRGVGSDLYLAIGALCLLTSLILLFSLLFRRERTLSFQD